MHGQNHIKFGYIVFVYFPTQGLFVTRQAVYHKMLAVLNRIRKNCIGHI